MTDANSPLNNGEEKQGFMGRFFGSKQKPNVDNKPKTDDKPAEQPGFENATVVNLPTDDGKTTTVEMTDEEKAQQAAKNKKTMMLLGGGVLATLVLAGGVIYTLVPKSKPVPQDNMASLTQDFEATAGEGENGLPPAAVDANGQPLNPDGTPAEGQQGQDMAVIGVDPITALKVRDSMETNHWSRSPTPIQELAKKAVAESVTGVPEYSADVQGLYITKDVVYTPMSPQYAQLMQQVQTDLEGQLNQRLAIANHQNKSFVVRLSNTADVALGAPPQRAIASANEYAEIDLLARQISMQILAEKINQARATIPQEQPAPEVAIPAPPVDTGISEAQRREYNRLQERSKALIEELTRKNKELLDEIAAKDKQMVEIMQKVEDTPKAHTKLKAHMLETKSNLKVQAIQGDLVFLADKNDKVYTVRIGDSLPERNNLVISNVDADTGIVYVTER